MWSPAVLDDGMHWDTRTTQNGDGTRFAGVISDFFWADTYVHAAWTAGPTSLLREGSVTRPCRSTSGQPTKSSDYPLRINRRTCGKRPRSYA